MLALYEVEGNYYIVSIISSGHDSLDNMMTEVYNNDLRLFRKHNGFVIGLKATTTGGGDGGRRTARADGARFESRAVCH